MKCAVAYATMTGHTKKLANAIANEIGVLAQNVKENPVIENVDILFIGGGIYGGLISPNLVNFINTLDYSKVKNVAIFMSSASQDYSKINIRSSLEEKGINVFNEEFSCLGGFLIARLGHPNKTEIASAGEFAKKIISEFND